MGQQFSAQNIRTKTSLLLFGNGWAAPLVLYFENPQEKYSELKEILNKPAATRVLELEAMGPIKKVSILASQITGLALQDEQYIQ